MQEPQGMWVQSLGWEDPLEEEMATHSSILAWETPWTEEPGGLQSRRPQRVGHDRATELTRSLVYEPREGRTTSIQRRGPGTQHRPCGLSEDVQSTGVGSAQPTMRVPGMTGPFPSWGEVCSASIGLSAPSVLGINLQGLCNSQDHTG